MEEFDLHVECIKEFETVREFEVWLTATDNLIQFSNIDNLIYFLIEINKPDFVMAALDFKRQYL